MTIHGFMTNTKDFGRLYDHLDCYDKVKAVEIPGHNGKEPHFEEFSPEATFRAVLDAYDGLKSRVDLVDVVGFSMGGALASWLASVRQVNRLVLISPANKYINASLPVAVGKYVGALGLSTFKETDGDLKEKLNATGKALEPYVENAKTTSNIAKSRTFRYFKTRTYTTFYKIIKSVNTVIETVSPNATPTLILWGELDELVPQRSVKYLAKHFTEAQVKIYPDVGHAMLYTNRDDVIIHDVVEFLSEGK